MERSQLTAQYVKKSLNLAKIEQKNAGTPLFRKERNLLVYQPAEGQFVCVYSFGVVTVFGVPDKKEVQRLVKKYGQSPEDEAAAMMTDVPPEEYGVIIDPDSPEVVEFDFIRLKNLSFEKLFLTFHVLAQSVAIDFLDLQADEALHKFEKIHADLAKHGRFSARTKEVMKMIGTSGMMIDFIIERLALLDKPDITWEDKEAEALYVSLRKMFELEDRFSSLRFKITFVQDSSELMLDVLQNRQAHFLEFIIIVLIVFEIIYPFIIGH